MSESSGVGDQCIVCGKLRREVNPFLVVQLSPLVCSPACAQRLFDEEGVTVHFPDGDALKVEPGLVKVTIDYGYPAYEVEWPPQTVTVATEDKRVSESKDDVADEVVLRETGVCNLPTPREVRILYKNWKGEVAWRRVVPLSVGFEKSQWHPVEQWVLYAFDVDKGAERSFAMADIRRWEVPTLAAAWPPAAAKEGGD